jgi:hypothetical protein
LDVRVSQVLVVAWHRFRRTFHHRWRSYFTIALLIGLLGGVAMGAVAGARRTQSVFPAYLAATDASDLQVQVYPVNFFQLSSPGLTRQLAHLAHVEHVASAPDLLVVPLERDGRVNPVLAANNEVSAIGSSDGEYFSQDRVTVIQGRMADPRSPNEIVASAEAAQIAGWHVGETVRFGGFTLQQASSPTFNIVKEPPAKRVSAKLVGLVVFASEVVHDEVDRFPTYVLMTPALTQRLHASAAFPTYALRLQGGNRYVAPVEQAIIKLLPPGSTYNFHVTSVVEGQVERSSKPEALALGVFGGIAALAALLIAALALSRALWANNEDLDVLRALGAGPATVTADASLGLLGAVIVGGLLAFGVAVALSPLAPLGPARDVNPTPGVSLDWTVLGVGVALLVLGLGLFTGGLASRRANRRFDERPEYLERRSIVVNAAARSGLSAPAVAGLRFSLERGHGRTAVPVRSALIGAVLAVAVVVATVTFGSSLNTLLSHPALYGWNWTYAISSLSGDNIPPAAGQLLGRSPEVAASTGFNFADVQIEGQTIPVLLTQANAPVTPPITLGHAIENKHQIVLGATTLAQLHKKLGQSVEVSYGSPADAPVYVPPTRLRIVGTATMPAIGSSGSLHPSLGNGALIPMGIEPPAFKRALTQPDPNLNGPEIYVVRLRSDVSASAGLALVRRIASDATRIMSADPQGQGDSYDVLPVQQPAEIINYETTGATPAVLASGLAVGAVVALGLTLTASVRRRRRDLAALKTLGFTQRQLAATVAWQASVAAVVGIILGVPLGIALGRWLWILFARNIAAVPDPTVPVLQIALIAIGTLVLANLVAAIPGRIAARTPTALMLRAE